MALDALESPELVPGNFRERRIIGKSEINTINEITKYYYNKSKTKNPFKRKFWKGRHSDMMCNFCRELTGYRFIGPPTREIEFNDQTYLVIESKPKEEEEWEE